MVAVALVGVVMSEGAPFSLLGGGHLCRCRRDGRRFFCIIKVARFEAKTAKTAYFFPLFALFFADGQTVRRLGDGVGWVFLLRVRVCFVIGGHCQLLPLSSVRLDCQLLPPLPVSP